MTGTKGAFNCGVSVFASGVAFRRRSTDLESRHTIPTSRHFRIGIFESSRSFALNKWLSSPSGVGQHVPILVFGEYRGRGMSESATNGVKDLLIDLYKIHENMSLSTQQSISGGGSSQMKSGDSSSSMTEIERKLKEKSEMRKAKRVRVVHNDVDKYLSDPNEGEEEENFDVLNWWRVNGVSKYPILARVAREILAIPVSTIASESSFSTSGRIIDPYRSSLSPKMVEALICTQNWLRSIHVALHHEPTIEEMEFCEEVEKEMASGSSKKGDMLPPKPPKH